MEMTDISKAAIEAAAKATREEICRQYREDERGKFPAGVHYYEEHVMPALIAEAALKAAAPFMPLIREPYTVCKFCHSFVGGTKCTNETYRDCYQWIVSEPFEIERLKAAGSYNDGIEAAAKVADKAIVEAKADREKFKQDEYLWCEQEAKGIAADIRALKKE